MDVELKKHCEAVRTDAEFIELCRSYSKNDSASLFDDVWELAVNERVDGTPTTASFLLAKLDLPATRGLSELLNEVALGQWNLSNRIVPFYLVSQFGKPTVLKAISSLTADLGIGDEKTRLEGVAYWARHPAESLIEPLHYFNWQEAIEGDQWLDKSRDAT